MQVLSSLSSIPFYAPSAGFAPTNSADVSAIASSYQVVSATATQIYAGTAYVTSVNDAPISASRAGNAANASLANSAWYDGTGRLISSLPDSAAVSAIASAYAESAASSKQDTLTFGYDGTSISSIDGSSLAGGGGGIDSATCSAIASAYAESAVSSKADGSALSSYVPYSSLEYNTASAISGINGSALAAGSTYSAGEGIDITDDVISVESPVDIVAGPGIVVDNPDGNTLRVSQAANYEVTLFENASGTTTNIVCSEKMSNFDRVRFYLYPAENTIASEYTEEFAGSSTMFSLTKLKYSDYANIPFVIYGTYYSTTDSKTITFGSTEHIWFGPSWNVLGTGNTSPIKIVKIVGIHRIANN